MARFEVPGGWVMQAYKYALDPAPAQKRSLWSHAGAARFARNHMLALVKATLDQRAAERSYGIAEDDLTPSLGWSLPALRRSWNQRKAAVAPWWGENSKEAYNTGLDSLARSLDAWSRSRMGQRAGATVGFPRFHSKRDRASVRFTTGTIRVEADRHHVTLPRLGTIRTHESTRKLARRIERGTARILSATVTRDSAGRWHVSFQTLVQRNIVRPAHVAVRHPVVGVDVGVKDLLVVATPDGTGVARVPAPESLSAARARLRLLQRKAARQVGPYDVGTKRKQAPSNRWRRIQGRIGKDARTRGPRAHRRTAQGHRVLSPAAPDHRSRDAQCCGDAGGWRCAQAWPEPGASRRRVGGGQADAGLQDHLVRVHARRSRPLVSVLQDLLGMRQPKAKAAAVRAHLHVRTLRNGPRPRPQRRDQPRPTRRDPPVG
jgi:putative transposase